MASKKLSELSISELQNKAKGVKNVTIAMIALAVIYAVFMFYQMFLGSFEMKIPQIVIPVVIVFLSLALQRQQAEISTEIKNRQSTPSNEN